jgi:hypothetical protein
MDMEFNSAEDAWDWLEQRLTVEPRTLPRSADFDRFEEQYGVRLPSSYRSFASRFGPGILGAFFRLAVPGNPAGAPWFDLDGLNELSVRSCPLSFIDEVHCQEVPVFEVADMIATIRRLVFFCSLDGSEYIGWDPEDVRDSDAPEYGVYILPRLGPPIDCAHSFEQFVFDICLGDRYPDYVPTDRQEWREYREESLWVYE